MFRCKVCGWIHEGIAPPNTCPSCGATADRFRPMDVAEINLATNELASYGIVGQGFDIDVDDTRRMRLLAFIDASFFSPYMERSGKRYPIYTGDAQWFSDNIPCMSACPSHTDISRYIALIADGRYADSYELNREHNVFPGCLGRMCARPCEQACRRKEVDAPIGICYLKRVAADYRGETRREIPPPWNGLTAAIIGAGVNGLTRRPATGAEGLQGHHLRAVPGAGRRDVDRRAGMAPAARCRHGRGRDDPRSRHRDPLQHRNRQGHFVQATWSTLRRGTDFGRVPDSRRASASPAKNLTVSFPVCSSWKTSIWARRMSGSASIA